MSTTRTPSSGQAAPGTKDLGTKDFLGTLIGKTRLFVAPYIRGVPAPNAADLPPLPGHPTAQRHPECLPMLLFFLFYQVEIRSSLSARHSCDKCRTAVGVSGRYC
jgi:hypothetical protein